MRGGVKMDGAAVAMFIRSVQLKNAMKAAQPFFLFFF